ncbi:MAG: response regulator [Pseudomonadota bacterium]
MASYYCLVVDSSRPSRLSLKLLLEQQGCRVAIADSGLHALNWLSTAIELPDFIFIDQKLPEENSLSTLKKIRQRSNYKNIRIIICTTKESSYSEEATLFGAWKVLDKPITEEKLKNMFEKSDNSSFASREDSTVPNDFMEPPTSTSLFSSSNFDITRDELEIRVKEWSRGTAREIAERVADERWRNLRPSIEANARQLAQKLVEESGQNLQLRLEESLIQSVFSSSIEKIRGEISSMVTREMQSVEADISKNLMARFEELSSSWMQRVPDMNELHQSLITQAKHTAQFTVTHQAAEAAQRIARETAEEYTRALIRDRYLPKLDLRMSQVTALSETSLAEHKKYLKYALSASACAGLLAIIAMFV